MAGEIQPCLFEEYDNSVRQMMDIVDRLRFEGVDKDISLPQIVVIGDQSSGKSSTLEALSGVQLPRGSGIVTRCPLVMSLRKGSSNDELSYHCILKYEGHEETIDKLDVSQIGDKITAAQTKLAGTNKNISSKPIHLKITSSTVPNITLVDLPGIARVPMEGQAKDIAKQTKDLIRKYIERDESLILVTAACDLDIATNEALNMAKEVDPKGHRTFGVLTKADRIEPGNEPRILKLLTNADPNNGASLLKGYTLIKCRSLQQLQKNMDLQDAQNEEEKFFKEYRCFNNVQKKLGTRMLAKTLTVELKKHLKRTMPELKRTVTEMLRSLRKEQSAMGEEIPADEAGKQLKIVQLLTGFGTTVTSEFGGVDVPSGGRNLWFHMRSEFGRFTDQMNLTPYVHPGVLVEEINQQRGSESVEFVRYASALKFVHDMINKCKDPATNCLKYIDQQADKCFSDLAEDSFRKFPEITHAVMTEFQDLREQVFEETMEALDRLFEMERLCYVPDEKYTQRLQNIKEEPFMITTTAVQQRKMSKNIKAHFELVYWIIRHVHLGLFSSRGRKVSCNTPRENSVQ